MSLPQGELEVAAVGLTAGVEPEEGAIQGRSLRQIAWRRLKQDKVAMAGGVGIIILTLTAVFASQINDLIGNQPSARNSALTSIDTSMPFGALSGASSKHWLGIQPIDGQDILARLIAGARTSLMISVSAMVVSLVLGLSVGLVAGYYRGAVDAIVARILDVLLAFPTLLFALALLAIFNQSPSFLGMSGQ